MHVKQQVSSNEESAHAFLSLYPLGTLLLPFDRLLPQCAQSLCESLPTVNIFISFFPLPVGKEQ